MNKQRALEVASAGHYGETTPSASGRNNPLLSIALSFYQRAPAHWPASRHAGYLARRTGSIKS